ncbi:NADP-dependent oxidoreductase [Streptomyces europaeiscabiei]|uniref:NADP-dependent oxidoreductase n=1 Tax=Streptomyces europaeiscabiei TaxID=146819 RepID=A0ABU4NDX1_9ACTN|nr:NADP-dependent oxidoreductase [Streptomyces europaeiscabiei]MDX2529748.1 NADP-dependent oxidoreductase [Streptomyces europaeiscabiei]MDX2756940.1 NADP-dependent oxidoreductase [Streptomyces europaeiscabiei]MDX2756977.1 NADP-dependent oxidoreductase [Streptomyces europaeiscabiei]MDX3544203.1 NADP-dependent oxidoreductase [Streptomyces europaeiscabiei]MDX3552437.1 NADP-dependent oxidoreductase [Streptomyces europaeiscabiei]
MKAVGFTEFGGPEVLQVLELPAPDAGPGEVRIRVHAATVNAVDALQRSGVARSPDAQPPFVPGMEAAGVVDQIGTGTNTDLRVGDRVMAIVLSNGSHGAYAEQVVVPVESVVRAPDATTDVQAATLPMNGLTARLALDTLRLEPGQTVAITGAAGAVGGYAVQLAKADGLRVVADASEQDEALIKELGADVVLRRGAEYPGRVRAEVPEGVDGLVDTASLGALTAHAVRDGGRVVTLLGYDGPGERDITYEPIVVFRYAREHARLDRLRQQAEDGLITLRVAKSFPAEQATEAHRLLAVGGVRGRLVLTF